MPMPVRSLPVVQNWDCHGCGECCRKYHIRVTAVEKARIESQGWPAEELGGLPPLAFDPHLGSDRLNQRPDGSCVFLGPDNRCAIHAKFGPAAKPMACRIYPFVLVPAGDHWRVGLRFACPAAVAGAGRPLTAHADDLAEYAGLMEADAGATAAGTPPPELQPGQSVPWPDLARFARAFADLMADASTPVEHRLRKVIALAAQCKPLRYEAVTGPRLKELLGVLSAVVGDEVPAKPQDVPPPGWVGRMIFRQLAAVYARTDHGPTPGVAKRGRWTRIRAAWRFAVGRGPVPKLHGLMPDATFEAADQPAGPLDPESEGLLARYYQVKLESLQFCGPTNFRRGFWDGLDSLMLTFPVVMWLSRVFAAAGARPRDEAVALAVQAVDDNFGYNKLLGAGRQVWATRALADRGELPRLVAWYAR
jgi:lysine-N-methylase